MPPSHDYDPERLLDDSRWIRRLALPLVGDEESAADLAQETWMVALRQRPGGGHPTRSWLAAVARNLAWKRRRSEARRDARERRQEREVTGPGAAELVSRAEAQQRVARAVLELDEPLRTTLLLRFFEDLPVAEVARRTEVETDTVRARIRRALGVLRARLCTDGGGSGEPNALRALLLPLTHGPSPHPSLTLGISMKLGSQLAFGLAVGVLGWLSWNAREERPQPSIERAQVMPPGPTEGPENVREVRHALAAPTPSEARASEDAARVELRGDVVFVHPDGREVAGAGGRFRLRAQAPDGGQRARTVELDQGRWSSSVASGSRITIDSLVMERAGVQRAARAASVFSGPVGGEPWHLRAELEPMLVLHVSREGREAELAGVQVLARSPREGSWPLVLDGARRERVRFEGDAPLHIPFGDPALAEDGLWVGARDHGWKMIRLEAGRDHEVWVELPAAGELEILFSGADAIADTELQLVRLDGPKGIRTDAGDDWEGELHARDRVLLTGVPAGEYLARLELKPFHAQSSIRLGTTPALVTAGERSTVRIERASLQTRERVDLTGALELPLAWGAETFRLTLDPVDVGPTDASPARIWAAADLESDADGVRRFELPAMPAGRYLVELVAYPIVTYREVVRIEPATSELSFSVPAPVEVRARAIDAASGASVAIAHLYHGQGDLPGVASSRALPADCGKAREKGYVDFRTPAGRLCVSLGTADGRRAAIETRVLDERNELVIEVR